SITMRPISVLVTSFSPRSVRSYSILDTAFSRSVIPTGRFSQAFLKPASIFPLSKTSLRPSFLTTSGRPSSSISAVLNLFEHPRHSRRLLMASISLLVLESITLLSANPQKGHFTGPHLRPFIQLREDLCAPYALPCVSKTRVLPSMSL